VHDCQGDAEITLKIKIKRLKGQFNSNYRSGIEVLEDEACDAVINLLPQDFEVEVLDVAVSNYEHQTAEREVDNED
jgi:hypothetical protein